MSRKGGKIGVDMVEVSRFSKVKNRNFRHMLKKLFSESEINYCLLHKDPAPHFAGIFAAKEAVSKALGTKKFPFMQLEIRHKESGAPEVWNKEKKLKASVSISHTRLSAVAVALSL